MGVGHSELVREVATREYLSGHTRSGRLKIRLGDMQQKLMRHDFPRNHIRQIGTALESHKFMREHGLKLEHAAGPNYKVDATLEYSFKSPHTISHSEKKNAEVEVDPLLQIAGILRGSIREGAKAFVKELRRDKVTEA